MENTLFKFYSQGRLACTESNLKGVKKYYIQGYASTVEKDLAGEVINESAQISMLRQFRNRNITIDVEHEEWYDNDGKQLDKPKSQMIPVAKVIEAKKDAKGTWVKAELNTNIDRFKEIWGSIKDGFLNAFSIGFFPISQMGNVISDLNIVNLTLTGTPVNTGATFTPVLKSAVAYLKTIEKESAEMVETQTETPVISQTETQVEPSIEDKVETVAVESAKELQTEQEIKNDESVAVVTEEKKEEIVSQVVKEVKKEVETAETTDSGISNVIEKIMEQKLKEFEEKFVQKIDIKEPKKETDTEQPVSKEQDASQEVQQKVISPLGMIKALQKRKSELGNIPQLKALVEDTPIDKIKETKQNNKTPLQMVV